MTLLELINKKVVLQSELARRVGTSRANISRWCSGKAEPKLREIPKLADALDVSVEEIVKCFQK